VGFAGLGVESSLVSTGHVFDKSGNEILGHVHQVVHIGIGLVELASGELGVVSKVNALIPKLFSDLENLRVLVH
jgi:hypothetical protein